MVGRDERAKAEFVDEDVKAGSYEPGALGCAGAALRLPLPVYPPFVW